MTTAAALLATFLVYVGSLPFAMAAALLLLLPQESQQDAPPDGYGLPPMLLSAVLASPRTAAVSCLTSYAAMILSFIGGLQQAAGLVAGEPRLVAAGIAIALISWALVLRMVLRQSGVFSAENSLTADPQLELLLLAVLYAWQAWLEACHPWWTALPAVRSLQRYKRSFIATIPLTCAKLKPILYVHSSERAGSASFARTSPSHGACRR